MTSIHDSNFSSIISVTSIFFSNSSFVTVLTMQHTLLPACIISVIPRHRRLQPPLSVDIGTHNVSIY